MLEIFISIESNFKFVSYSMRDEELVVIETLKVRGFSSYIDSYCFIVIASSLFPHIPLRASLDLEMLEQSHTVFLGKRF